MFNSKMKYLDVTELKWPKSMVQVHPDPFHPKEWLLDS